MEFLFDKDAYRKYLVMQYLYDNREKKVLKKELGNHIFGCSKTIMTTIQLIKEPPIGDRESARFEIEVDYKWVRGTFDRKFNIDKLKEFYLRESIAVKISLQLFEKNELILSNFSVENYYTQTIVKNKMKELNQKLKEHNIHLEIGNVIRFNGYRTYANLRYTVTAVEDQTSIEAKDSTIYVNTPWTAEDNFISATDKNGDLVDFSEVTVSGTVDTTTQGAYDVTYSYGGKSITITVTVVEDQATLVVKDSTIYVGTPWTAADNFISATDRDGNEIALADVTVSGTVDTTTPGEYEVTYSYGGLTQIATITVVEEKPANPTPPVVPTQPTIPGVPGETPVAPSKPTELKTDYTSDLPQAGGKRMETALLSRLGVGLTLATALFLGFGKRRKNEENKT